MQGIFLKKYGNSAVAFEQKETDKPTLSAGGVLIKLTAFGLNYADVMARNGLYKDAPPLPCILGYEGVGIVEAVADGVTNVKVGQRVIAFTRFGSYAEYVVADYRAVVGIDDEVSNGTAVALATQYCTAYYAAVEMANIKKGDHILIHAAAGGVGTALTQIAKNIGCIIYGTAGSDEKLTYIKKQGVAVGINYLENNFATAIKKTNQQMDVIFDPVGGTSFKKDKTILAHGGRIICYGGSERSTGGLIQTLKFVAGFGLFSPIALLMKSQGIIGVNMLRIADHKPEVLQRCMENVVKLYQQGVIKPFVGGVFNVKEIGKAHQFLESRKSTGKIVVEW